MTQQQRELLKKKAREAGTTLDVVLSYIQLGVTNYEEIKHTDILLDLYKPVC